MSSLTDYLELFMYNTNTDGKEVFSIDQAMNANWNKLDSTYHQITIDIARLKNPTTKQYILGDKTSITIKANTTLKLGTQEYYWDEDETFSVNNILDTGTIQAGKDYCIYLTIDGIKISANSTYPDTYNSTNSIKIGGFHTLCIAVTSFNVPTLAANSFWGSHPAIGYKAGDIIPNSVWCTTHRPYCDPSGMVYINGDKYGEHPFWVDIYLQSGTLQSTKSRYGGTLVNNRQPMLHAWDMLQVGKKLPTDNQFLIFAEGSNQKTNIVGSKLPSPATTGGHLDTAGKRMISGYFVEECCGYVWQWLDELAPTGGTGWNQYADTARGGTYGVPYVLGAGGRYGDSTNCGSWSRTSHAGRLDVYAFTGARGVSLSV